MTKEKRIDNIMSIMLRHYEDAKKYNSFYELILASFYLGKLMEIDRSIGSIYINQIKNLASKIENNT